MTRKELKRRVNFWRPPPNEKVLASKWWKAFRNNLSNLSLVRDFDTIKSHPLNLSFMVNTPERENLGKFGLIRINPDERKSWTIDRLICELGIPGRFDEFGACTLWLNALIIEAIEKDFYQRFARELADWVFQEYNSGNYSENLISYGRGLIYDVYRLAIVSQANKATSDEEKRRQIDEFDRRGWNSFSWREHYSALKEASLNYFKLQNIDDKIREAASKEEVAC